MRVNNYSGPRGVRRYFIGVLALFAVCLSVVVSSNAQSTGGAYVALSPTPRPARLPARRCPHQPSERNPSRNRVRCQRRIHLLEVPVEPTRLRRARRDFKKYLPKGLTVTLNEVLTLAFPCSWRFQRDGGSSGAAELVDTTSTQLGQW